MRKLIYLLPLIGLFRCFQTQAQPGPRAEARYRQSIPIPQNVDSTWVKSSPIIGKFCANHPYTLLIRFTQPILKNDQADMIIKGISNYFSKGYAFSPDAKIQQIPTALVLQKQEFNTPIYEGLQVIIDSNKIQNPIRIITDRGQTTADIILVNQNSEIIYKFLNYKGVGEQLRPMERQIKGLFGDTIASVHYTAENNAARPEIGSTAPDFYYQKNKKISDLIGKKSIIISFYPAPFTGNLYRNVVEPKYISDANSQTVKTDNNKDDIKVKKSPGKALMGGCGGQAIYFENLAFGLGTTYSADQIVGDTNAVFIYISASSSEILNNWEKYLGTKKIIYSNDPNNYTSRNYGSFDYKNGYNYRSLIIVNKEGKITYANYNLGAYLPSASILEKYLK